MQLKARLLELEAENNELGKRAKHLEVTLDAQFTGKHVMINIEPHECLSEGIGHSCCSSGRQVSSQHTSY